MLHLRSMCPVRSMFIGSALAGCLALPATVSGQTPMGIRNVSKDTEASAQAVAVNNPWFGAQIAHRFGTEGEFESNLLAAGQFMYEIKFKVADTPGTESVDPTDPTAKLANASKPAPETQSQKMSFLRKFHLPVVSNFGGDIGPDSAKDAIENQVKELLSSAAGITAGLFPYYELSRNDNLMLTLHGLFAWRYNSLKPFGDAGSDNTDTPAESDDTELVPLHQVKGGFGIEAIIGDRSDGKGGLTVGVTPVLTWFTDKSAYKRAFGEERSSLAGVEIVGIIPVSDKGVGVVLEGVAAAGGKRSFRAGLMFIGKPN